MPTLLSEVDVKLEPMDMLRRIALPHQTDDRRVIIPPPRSPGLHLSGVLHYIAKTTKLTTYHDQIAEEEHPLRWALGQAWEEFAASLYPEMLWQPGEVDYPVLMTPDGISTATGEITIEEFKFNRSKKYKGSDLIARKWLWMMQGAGYCLGYGPDTVRWHVCSAMEFPDPIYTIYTVQFSRRELEQTRSMIEANKDAAIAEGYAE